MKKLNFDTNSGKILGWYDTEINNNIPANAVDVSDEKWREAIESNYNCYDEDSNTFSNKDFRSQEDINLQRIAELTGLLEKSDFKVLPDYDQDNAQIKIDRLAWREEIRQLEDGNNE